MKVASVEAIWRYPVKSMAGESLAAVEINRDGLLGDRGWALLDDRTGEVYNAKRHPVLMACTASYRQLPSVDEIGHVNVTLPDGSVLSSDSPMLRKRLSELLGRHVGLRRRRPSDTDTVYSRRQPWSSFVGWLTRSDSAFRWAASRPAIAAYLTRASGEFNRKPLPKFARSLQAFFAFYTLPGTFFDVFPVHLLTTSALARMAEINPDAKWDVRRFRPNILLNTAPTDGVTEKAWIHQQVRINNALMAIAAPTIRCAMTTHAQGDLSHDPSVLRTIVRSADKRLGVYAAVVRRGSIATGDAVELLRADREFESASSSA